MADRLKHNVVKSVFRLLHSMLDGKKPSLLGTELDVKVQQVSNLEILLKVKEEGTPARYFTVKISEQI